MCFVRFCLDNTRGQYLALGEGFTCNLYDNFGKCWSIQYNTIQYSFIAVADRPLRK